MFTQLNPSIPVYLMDKKQSGYAIAVIDYSEEHNLKWVVALNNNGEIWVCDNTNVRLQWNYSLNRRNEA